jgi:diaminopimelate epimerase
VKEVIVQGIPFSKLNGSGNDFILIDNRRGVVPEEDLPRLARTLCRRRFSVGADGLIAIEDTPTADFRWRFFNADGSSAGMCGNGGRCAARFAVETGIAGPRLRFETLAGPIRAEVHGRRVKLEMLPPVDYRPSVDIPLPSGTRRGASINTGVPHVVLLEEELEAVDVKGLGSEIRHHALFAPAGTNVDFIRRNAEAGISVRTYERGVEDETLACGTGAMAGALIGAIWWGLASPVKVRTRGGEALTVQYSREGDRFRDVFLEGDTVWVYDGRCVDEMG